MMNLRVGYDRIALLVFLGSLWMAAAWGTEVYTWTDENGVVHYSDAPRDAGDAEVIEVEEVYRPGTADAYPPSDPADTPPVADPPAGSGETPLTPAQQKREQMARERAERQQSQAETDRLCALHRQRLEQIEPARRVLYTDEQGETVRLDDDTRMGLIDESKAFLAANCR